MYLGLERILQAFTVDGPPFGIEPDRLLQIGWCRWQEWRQLLSGYGMV